MDFGIFEVDYAKKPNFFGTDTLIVSVCDTMAACGSASVYIMVTEDNGVHVPEGFSPNGDKINDFFVIPDIFDYPDNKLTIYNRWGNVVFEKAGYDNTWSGTKLNTDVLLPAGTYFYVLNLGNGRSKNGYLYIRK